MLKRLLLALAFLIPSAQASDFSDWRILELREAYIDFMHYTWARDPFMGPYIPDKRLDVHFNLDLFNRIMFIDNMVHSKTDQSQYRLIGWNYRMGFHLGDSVDLYFDHFSQHILDAPLPNGVNTYDAIGVRIYLYKRKGYQ